MLILQKTPGLCPHHEHSPGCHHNHQDVLFPHHAPEVTIGVFQRPCRDSPHISPKPDGFEQAPSPSSLRPAASASPPRPPWGTTAPSRGDQPWRGSTSPAWSCHRLSPLPQHQIPVAQHQSPLSLLPAASSLGRWGKTRGHVRGRRRGLPSLLLAGVCSAQDLFCGRWLKEDGPTRSLPGETAHGMSPTMVGGRCWAGR